jgi:translation elongation factor EF-Tu-like GTPase
MWPFRRRREVQDDMAVDTLLARANQASPPSTVFTEPPADVGPFRMPVEDTFFISGRGLVATGRVEAGTLSVGAEVRVVRAGQVVAAAKVTGIEQFRKVTDTATAGQTIGVLLGGLAKELVSRGDVLTA